MLFLTLLITTTIAGLAGGTTITEDVLSALGVPSAPSSAVTATPAPGVPVSCRPDEMPCDGTRCVPLSYRCDRSQDCADGADEPDDCPTEESCASWLFQCATSGLCIPQGWLCDGEPDCGKEDASDEHRDTCPGNSTCPGNTFQCHDLLSCIPVKAVCDQHKDCLDGSDEGDFCAYRWQLSTPGHHVLAASKNAASNPGKTARGQAGTISLPGTPIVENAATSG